MGLLDWSMKRNVRSMLGAYLRVRSSGHSHSAALLDVLNSTHLSQQQRSDVWERFQFRQTHQFTAEELGVPPGTTPRSEYEL